MFSKVPKYLWLVVVVSLLPIFADAHGNNYFEFNPDYFRTQSFNISSAGSVYEVFLPSNEFLGSFDVWLDNAGSPGLAYFELWRGGNLITAKSLTIPHIDLVAGGQKVHIDWGSLVPVVSNGQYKIKISSTMPDLQIYYASRVKFLGHNEPHISDYINGVAEIDGEEKEFSFKFALYETSEASVPAISNVSWAIISEGEMKVSFNANEPVDYRIEYWPFGQGYTQSSNFSGNYSFCNEGVSICNIVVSVASNITYQYLLTIKDFWGNQNQASGTFTSGQVQAQSPSPTPAPDEIPLIVSNFRIVNKTDKAVEIVWTTNKASNSSLLVSFSSDLITITAVFDPTFELEHLLQTDSVLSPGTTYTARVTSVDFDNNESMASLSFQTLLTSIPSPTPSVTLTPTSQPLLSPLFTSPTTMPTPSPSSSISFVSPTPVNSTSQVSTSSSPAGDGFSTGIIQWNQPVSGEPKDGYRVDVFDKDGKLVTSLLVSDGSHGIGVPNLVDGEYTVIVYANNDGVFKKIDKPVGLRAGEPPFFERLLSFWPYLLLVIILTGLLIWFRKRQSSQKISQVVS